MVSRADVNRLRDTTGKITGQAVGLLEDFFGAVDLSKPKAVRDALLEVVPAIVDVYGDMAATVAAEWYEDLRRREVGGTLSARLAEPDNAAAVRGSVRWAAGELFTDHPRGAFDLLKGSLQRHVTYGARATIARNVAFDPAKPRWAHVSSGEKPCPWCVVMSSRGWVYHTKESAALNSKRHADFHDGCQCHIVASWDATNAHIEGYDPDADYALYKEARDAGEPGEPLSKTVSRMRAQHPELFTK